MKEKKVVFLSYDGITDPLGQSQVLPYLLGLSTKSKLSNIKYLLVVRINVFDKIIKSFC